MQNYLYIDLYTLEENHWWHVSKRKIVRYLIEKYVQKKNPHILDVGCGTGKNIEELKRYGQVWGIDNSLDAIKFCKKRGLDNVKQGNAENIRLPANSFDIITLLDVLEHTDDNKALNEMKRVLKKGGFLIVTVPAFPWLWSKWDEILHHKKRYTAKSLKEIFKSYDFSVIYLSYCYSFLVLPALFIRIIKSFISRKNYSSDFKLSNFFFNIILGHLATSEFWLAQRLPLPIGTSIIAIVKNEK